ERPTRYSEQYRGGSAHHRAGRHGGKSEFEAEAALLTLSFRTPVVVVRNPYSVQCSSVGASRVHRDSSLLLTQTPREHALGMTKGGIIAVPREWPRLPAIPA